MAKAAPPRTADQVIDAWVICQDHPAHPDHRFIAQLTTERSLPYVLVGDTLAEVQAQLPPGLLRYGRGAVEPPEVIEMWVAA
jgi:hypothetical protein